MKVLQCALLLGLALSAAAKSERERLTESAMKAAQVSADPAQCGQWIDSMNSQAYIACDDMGFAMSSLENGGSYTDQEAKSFCTNECATMMHDTVSNLVAYCDLPAGDTDITNEMYALWIAACHQENGQYCDVWWKTMMSENYIECTAQVGIVGPCPAICNTTLTSLKHDLGCCYKSIADVNIKFDPPYYFGPDLWKACGISEPPPCK